MLLSNPDIHSTPLMSRQTGGKDNFFYQPYKGLHAPVCLSCRDMDTADKLHSSYRGRLCQRAGVNLPLPRVLLSQRRRAAWHGAAPPTQEVRLVSKKLMEAILRRVTKG